MAKSYNFFGLRRGSTKSLTFQVFRGKQITKDRVTDVRNPQSAAQMRQRLLIPMVAQARTQLKGLVNHSFEGVEYGWQSLAEFSRQNLKKGALVVHQYVPYGSSATGEADFIVSKGGLGSTHLLSDSERTSVDNPAKQNDKLFDGEYFVTYVDATGVPSLDFSSAKTLTLPTGTTLEDKINAYGADRFLAEVLGLSGNQQLTFLAQNAPSVITFTADDTEYTIPRNAFVIGRTLNLAEGETTLGSTVEMIDGEPETITETYSTSFNIAINLGGTGGSIVVGITAMVRTTGTNTYEFLLGTDQAEPEGTYNGLMFLNNAGEPRTNYAAVIFSDYVNGVWKRSEQRMEAFVPSTPVVPFDTIVQGYLATTTASSKYLNNGNDSTGISGQTDVVEEEEKSQG